MATHTGGFESTTATGQRTHSKERAVDERAFLKLVEATYRMDDLRGLEARFVLYAAGRFGLRAGEIVHFRESWVDHRRRMISIPSHEPCEKGRGGGICGYCRQHSEQMADHNPGITPAEAAARRWRPKTPAAAREIPLDAHTRAAMVVEEFCDRVGDYPNSRTTINRRVEEVCELTEGVETTPHGLRATAASYYASRGIDVLALQSLMGWSDLQTAHCYVRRSGERTARALRDIQR